MDWFRGKARTAAGFRTKIIRDNPGRSRNSTVIGRMYAYWYDPKWKDVLPIYDRFPLVFPIERYNNGFLGINLHYLSVNERLQLLTQLRKYRSSKTLTPTSRLKLSYELLSSTAKLKGLTNPCIKRYLWAHVQSQFVEITPDEWDKVVALPIELFVRKN